MKDRELMAQALLAIEGSKLVDPVRVAFDLRARIREIKNQEEWYSLPKETRDKLKMAAKGNRNLWKPELDPKFQKAKELRASGAMVKDACAQAGLTLEQWYRRQAIEKFGKARSGGKRRPT